MAEDPNSEYASRAEVATLTEAVGSLASLVKEALGRKADDPKALKEEKEIEKAGPNKYSTNPEWEEIAREIIGDEFVDHTEVDYVKGGGLRFTVVIRTEKSNAPIDYLERHHVDRRSKEVGQEGENGVRTWCEQIKGNLKKERPVPILN